MIAIINVRKQANRELYIQYFDKSHGVSICTQVLQNALQRGLKQQGRMFMALITSLVNVKAGEEGFLHLIPC